MGTKLTYLILLLLFTNSVFGVAHFNSEWKVSSPHPDRYFLVHQNDKTVILVTKYKTNSSVSDFEEYFADKFTEDSFDSRKAILESEKESASKLQTGSNTYKGVRYGASSATLKFNGSSDALMFERIWASQNTVWHLAMIHFDKSSEEGKANLQMNQVMDALSAPVKTSFLKSLLPYAYAEEEKCAPLSIKSVHELSDILPFVSKLKDNRRCSELNVDKKDLSTEFGFKLHKASMVNCFEGRAEAIAQIKEEFLSSLKTWSQETSKRIQQMQCQLPERKDGLLNSLAYNFAMEAYSECLTNAGMSAAGSMVVQSVVQTGKGLRDLYNWAKAEKNPAGVLGAFIASKDATFMCLTPEAQMKKVCELVTHVAALGAKVALGVGAGAALKTTLKAANVISSIPKAVSSLPSLKAEALAQRIAAKGSIDQTFKETHPFVRKVAEGNAEAAKVIEALKRGAILEKTTDQIDAELIKKGFAKITTCIRLEGKCVKHINPHTGLEEEARMIVYVHPSGVAARIKPDGLSNAKFRPQPHGSFMLVDPEGTKLAEGIKVLKKDPSQGESFMTKFLSWDQELAKVDMHTGKPLPSAPARTRVPAALGADETRVFHDTISNLTHFPLN